MRMKSKYILIIILSAITGTAQERVSVEPAFKILNEFDKVRDFTMDKTGVEAYFTIQSQTEEISIIAKSSKKQDDWETPTIPAFSGKFKDLEPFLAPDGLRLYFVSNRPLHDPITEAKDFNIWYVKRTNMGADWSEPINIGMPINTDSNEFYPTVAENGNLYFTCDCAGAKGRDDIFFSEFKDGTYTTPVSLDENINSEGFEYNSYISQDDSYLIFGGYNREDGQGSGDMYISFKDATGKWSKAIPLPTPINSKYMDYCPFVDEQNNILYFTSRRTSNPEEKINSIDNLKNFLNSYENGNSRLYKVSFDVKTIKDIK